GGAAGARAVLGDELLAKRGAHALTEEARHDVVAAAGREGDDDDDRAGGVGLRVQRANEMKRAGDQCEQRGEEGTLYAPPPLAGEGGEGEAACSVLVASPSPALQPKSDFIRLRPTNDAEIGQARFRSKPGRRRTRRSKPRRGAGAVLDRQDMH